MATSIVKLVGSSALLLSTPAAIQWAHNSNSDAKSSLHQLAEVVFQRMQQRTRENEFEPELTEFRFHCHIVAETYGQTKCIPVTPQWPAPKNPLISHRKEQDDDQAGPLWD